MTDIEHDPPMPYVVPTFNNPCPRENYTPAVPDKDVLALIEQNTRQANRIAILEAALETALERIEQIVGIAMAPQSPGETLSRALRPSNTPDPYGR